MLEIENIINCGRKKEDPYFSLRDKFRERIFTPPVQPVQMIFYWTLPEKFEPENLDKEFAIGFKQFPADVYNESINSMIDKMREHSKNMNRLFVCPCTDDETRKKILDALHIIFPERKKDVEVLYKNEPIDTIHIPDYLKNVKTGDYLTTKSGNVILVHHVEFEGKDLIKVYHFFEYSKRDDKIYKNEFMSGFYGPSEYDFYRPSTDVEIEKFAQKLYDYGYEWDDIAKHPVLTEDGFLNRERSKYIASIIKSLKALTDSEGNKIFSDTFLESKYCQHKNDMK